MFGHTRRRPNSNRAGICVLGFSSNKVWLAGDCFLIQHVSVPTRNNNILDLVMTTEATMVENTQVIEHFCNSDHNTVIWDLVLRTHITDKMHKKKHAFTKQIMLE